MKHKVKRALALLLACVMLAGSVPFAGAGQTAAGDLDASGNITAADARLALRAAVGLDRLTPEQALSADADHSGSISAADARLILRCAVGLEEIAHISVESMVSSQIKGDAKKPYESSDYQLLYLASVTAGGAEHTLLDESVTLYFPVSEGITEEDLINIVGVTFNDAGDPFFILPDPEARAQGKLWIDTIHFSLFGAAKLSDEKLLDLWAERAAAQSTVRRISEDEITPGLSEMIADGLNAAGLGKDQYAGAIVRGILSLDTRGEILTAAIDGDGKTLRAKLINFAGEYFLGKLFKQEEDKFLTQSLGDNADSVKKAVKEGKYKEAMTEIVKTIEKNMFSYVNYADKIASLTDKLANIWTDDMMNEQYEVYKKLGGAGISDDDWNLVYMQLRGAATRLSSKGISAEALRKKFEQRVKNEEKIAAAKKELLEDAAQWRELGLLNTTYWYNSLGDYPPDTERLNSLRQIREMLRGLLTLDGKFQRGKGYMTDKAFLTDALFEWVTNGIKGRDKFYKWLRDNGVYLPREETVPPGVDPDAKTVFVTPTDVHSRQYYSYMDDVERLIMGKGKRALYASPVSGKKTMSVTVPDPEGVMEDGIAVTGLQFSFTYTGRGENATGKCSFTWTQPRIFNEGDPNFEIRWREEHTFVADSVTVTDTSMNGGAASYVFVTFNGREEYRRYEMNRLDGEYYMYSGFPITRDCSFYMTFAY